MEHLERLGLVGPYQVHVAPVVLAIDERAHQVFSGFGAGLADLAQSLSRRLPAASMAFVLRGNARQVGTLQETASSAWLDGDVLVVPATNSEHPGGLYGLVWVVDRLLGPGGCPWDQEQTHESLKKHLIEEAYELCDAIDGGTPDQMVEELGDVLLQPVMHAQLDTGPGIEKVCQAVTNKLVRRHPHVFGDAAAADSEEVLKNWDAIKDSEKGSRSGVLAGVPRSAPALVRALEVSKRAARAGFEWPHIEGVWAKLAEEERELRDAVSAASGMADELGDLLFTVVNLARWMKVDPEDALRLMVDRFVARFERMEQESAKPLGDLSAEEWDALWNRAKAAPNEPAEA